jgi:hypothetical protein
MSEELVKNSDEFAKTITELLDRIKTLTEERDEARREVLTNEANHLPTMSDPYREAKRRGWDCLEPRRPWDSHKDYK